MKLAPLHGEGEVAEGGGQGAGLQGGGGREVGDVRRQDLRRDHGCGRGRQLAGGLSRER